VAGKALNSDAALDEKADELEKAAEQLRERANQVGHERDALNIKISEAVRKLNEVAELTKR